MAKYGAPYAQHEPYWLVEARDAYWLPRLWVERIELRIQSTNAGLAWLMRVKAI